MEKLLIICEKPNAAKAFSKALGGQSGNFQGDSYAITNLYGHIMELGKPAEVAIPSKKEVVGDFGNVAGIPWDPSYFNFYDKQLKPDTEKFDGYSKAYKAIATYLNAGYIPVIASDIDTYGEGDLLVQEVLDSLRYKGKRYREYHASEEVKDIIKAMQTKKEVTDKDPAYMTGFTRSACDFLTQQYTRVATTTIQDKGYQLPAVVPFGRVQSVVVSLVGKQLEAIANYKPSSVWESRYRLDNLVLTAPDLPQFATKEEWEARGLPMTAPVKKTREVPGKTPPPKPLNLTKLGSIVAKHGLSLTRVKNLTQQLYDYKDEEGRAYLSYPRSEDTVITTEQFNEILPMIDNYINLLGLAPAIFTHRAPRKTHVQDSAGHGALRPGACIPESLEELDAKFGPGASIIYKTVTERFLLMFLEDTEWVRHEYETQGVDPVFKGSIKIITKQGVIDPDAEVDKEIDTTLPDTSKEAELYPHEIKSVKPANPTTSWLLDQLMKHDVGTAATQVSIVADMIGLTDKHPVRDGKILELSLLGQIGYEAAKGTLIGSIEGTRFMQECIKAVSKGTFTPEQALSKFNEAIKKDMDVLRRKQYNLDNLNLPKRTPKEIVTGIWNGQEVAFNRHYSSHRFDDHEVEQLLAGKTLTIEITTPKGTFKVRGRLDNMEYQGRRYIGFNGEFVRDDVVTGSWQGETVTFKNQFAGHLFTPSEIQKLLTGETITFSNGEKDFTGKLARQEYQGRPYVGFKAEFPKREGYVYGTFKGQEISFKGSFMDHTFTEDEIEKLLAGTKIVFKAKSKKGNEMTVAGGLEQQTYKGKLFWGFKAEFDKQK